MSTQSRIDYEGMTRQAWLVGELRHWGLTQFSIDRFDLTNPDKAGWVELLVQMASEENLTDELVTNRLQDLPL